ncbi:MAG: hypothetical protein AAF988_02915 [Pseudomonadota bacterium]
MFETGLLVVGDEAITEYWYGLSSNDGPHTTVLRSNGSVETTLTHSKDQANPSLEKELQLIYSLPYFAEKNLDKSPLELFNTDFSKATESVKLFDPNKIVSPAGSDYAVRIAKRLLGRVVAEDHVPDAFQALLQEVSRVKLPTTQPQAKLSGVSFTGA